MPEAMMTFDEARLIAEAGGRIYRHSWVRGWTAGMHDGELTSFDRHGRLRGLVGERDRAGRNWLAAEAWAPMPAWRGMPPPRA